MIEPGGLIRAVGGLGRVADKKQAAKPSKAFSHDREQVAFI
jgi:hypothetical protein